MDPLTLGIGAASAIFPSVMDWFSGASRKERQAQEQQQALLRSLMDRYTKDAGASASDSLAFKTSSALINKDADRQWARSQQDAAARGASDEARLGAMQTLNDSTNTASLHALTAAQQERQRLLDQRDLIAQQMAGLKVQQAAGASQRQQQLGAGISSMLPGLLSTTRTNFFGGGGFMDGGGSSSLAGGGMFSNKSLGVTDEMVRPTNYFSTLFPQR